MTRVALAATTIVVLSCTIALAQTAAAQDYLLAYFLDEPPTDIKMSALPSTARDIVVARVNLTQRPTYLVRREPPDDAPPPEYLFRSKFRIVEVLSGPATADENLVVTFSKPNHSGRMTMVPLRDQINRDYFVIAYVDEVGQRHLAGYPISEAKYQAWEAAAREQMRLPR